jgi:glutamate-1-semialdehyde 2,1-aminomutase
MTMTDSLSGGLYKEAEKVMVGGVSSPVRAFRAVGGGPLFMVRGRGSKIWDVDGNVFVDYVCSWGPLILGHSNPVVTSAVRRALKEGVSFGAPTIPELRLAQKVCAMIPSIEKVRFVNSGTEATMSALRLARAFTGRTKFVKFDGCYHGHSDPFLTKAGSGMATYDLPASAGVPPGIGRDAITLGFNDLGALDEAFRRKGTEVAAIIVEPVAGNMGVVPPSRGFLERLRKLCDQHGCVLIFDEVITGFRVAPGGAQERYGVKADLTCLGKIIGGGFPVGAYGGRREIMELVAPQGPVYQAGTLSGNPVAMSAGLATLSLLKKAAYAKLESISHELEDGLLEEAASCRVDITINRVGSMISLFFGPEAVGNYKDARASGFGKYPRFHRSMLESGVYLAPSAFETSFLSLAHSEADLSKTLQASRHAFKGLGK